MFGTYPQLYQEGEYFSTRTIMDISGDSLAAVGYQLTPDVGLYDLNREGYPLVEKISLSHPEFRDPEETPLEIATTDDSELYERLSRSTMVKGIFTLRDGCVPVFLDQLGD